MRRMVRAAVLTDGLFSAGVAQAQTPAQTTMIMLIADAALATAVCGKEFNMARINEAFTEYDMVYADIQTGGRFEKAVRLWTDRRVTVMLDLGTARFCERAIVSPFLK